MKARNTSFRPALSGDVAAMIAVQMRSAAAGYPQPIRSLLAANPNIVELEVRTRWAAGDLFAVGQREGSLVGFAAATVGRNAQAELSALFVEPTLWRMGIGTALTNFMVQILSDAGVKHLVVFANPLAEAFYSAAGFEISGLAEMPNYGLVPKFYRPI